MRFFAPSPLARSRFRVAIATAVMVLLFALVGWAAGPRWHPETLTTTIDPVTDSVAVNGSSPQAVLGRYETTSSIVELELTPEVSTQVLIVEPVGLTEPAPAVVFLHGAGTGLAEAFAEHAEALASAGIVAVSPSKRLDTYSTANRDYPAMAVDYAKSVDLARSLPSVDPDRVGLYSESEGTWVAPIMAAADPDLAFVGLISAPVVTPREQGAFAVDAYLRAVGVPNSLLRAIPRATGAQFPGGILAYADFDMLPFLAQVEAPIFMAYGTKDQSMPTVQGAQIVLGTVPGGADQVLVRYYGDANHGIRIGSSSDPVIPDFLAGVAAWILDPAGSQEAGPAVAGATPVQVHLASAVPHPRWYADGEMLLRVPVISASVLALGYLLLVVAGVLSIGVRRRARLALARSGATGGAGAARLADDRALAGEGRARGGSGDGAKTRSARTRGTNTNPASSQGGQPRIVRGAVVLTITTIAVLATLVAYVIAVAQLALNYSTDGVVVWGGWVLLQLLAVVSALTLVLALRAHLRAAGAWARQRERAALVGRLVPLVPRTLTGAAGLVRVTGSWAVILGCAGLLVVAAYWGAFSPLS